MEHVDEDEVVVTYYERAKQTAYSTDILYKKIDRLYDCPIHDIVKNVPAPLKSKQGSREFYIFDRVY